MKNKLLCTVLAAICLMILLLFCACAPQQEAADISVIPATETPDSDAALSETNATDSQAEQKEDNEVIAAIADGEPALLWRIDEAAQLGGTVSMWHYTPMDCEALWAEIQAKLLPDASVQSAETVDNGEAQSVELRLGENTIRVNISATGIYFIGYTPEAASAFSHELAELLTERSGFTLTEVPADQEEGELLCYAFCAERVAVDTEPYDVTMGSALRVSDSGLIQLEYPISLGERIQTYDLSQYFSMQEAKLLCELQWEANFVPLVCTLDSYAPVYIIDATEGKLIPGWQFLGRFWEISDTGFNHGMDYVINALTGEVIRFG